VPVLVQGETGSGKECLVREALATAGLGRRLVALRCAALTVEHLVDQLGADANEPCVLLLDEVGELAPAAQAALLIWLDERMESPRACRVVATTQHDLGAAVATRRFRADLLYRLQGVAVCMPPLRERSDFEACARHAMARIAPQARVDARAVELLQRQPWPGNWRELQSVLTRAWYALDAPADGASVLIGAARLEAQLGPPPAAPTHASVLQQETTTRVLREWERQGGSISATARRLGISRNTVYRHLREAERLPQGKVGDALR
jgi:transcriptional regulator of acetoin/glycerol metabolism